MFTKQRQLPFLLLFLALAASAQSISFSPADKSILSAAERLKVAVNHIPAAYGACTVQLLYSCTGDPKDNGADGGTLSYDPDTSVLPLQFTIADITTGSNLRLRVKFTNIQTQAVSWSEESTVFYYPETGPIISPASSTFMTDLAVTITLPYESGDSLIFYTTDGSAPYASNPSAIQYSEPFTISETTTVKAAIQNTHGLKKHSSVSEVLYQNGTHPATPAISPANGASIDAKDSGQNTATLIISSTTPQARLFYTTDGSEPVNPAQGTNPNQKEFTAPVTLSQHGYNTIQAIAVLPDRPNSEIAYSRFYLYNRPPAPLIAYSDSGKTTTAAGSLAYHQNHAKGSSCCFQFTNQDPDHNAYISFQGTLPQQDQYSDTLAPGQTKTNSAIAGVTRLVSAWIPAQGDTDASRVSALYVKYDNTDARNTAFSKADLNRNDRIESGDVNILRALWGTNGAFNGRSADCNGDGTVNQKDLDFLETLWWQDKNTCLDQDRCTSPYLVIDVSGGPNAQVYPYEFVQAQDGDWNATTYKTDKIVLRLIPLPTGTSSCTFTMGSPATEVGRSVNADGTSPEDPVQVTLTKPYFLGVFEITQQQWYNVMGAWPSYYCEKSTRATRPVEAISYLDIRGSTNGKKYPASNQTDEASFLGLLRKKTGLTELELPTEAQWEYACRAMTDSPFSCFPGQLSKENLVEMPNLFLYARYTANTYQTYRDVMPNAGGTALVGSYQPNHFGLYDMHGNVAEWCLTGYGPYPAAPATDPEGAASTTRAVRGGSCNSSAAQCRSAARSGNPQSFNLGTAIGFRLCYWLPF